MLAPRVVRHSDPRSFLSVAQPLLDCEPAAYSGLVAWARALERRPADGVAAALFFTVRDGERAVGFGLQRERGPLVIGNSDPGAAAQLAVTLARRDVEVPGVMGSRAACEAFAASWHARTGHVHRVRFHLVNYVLERAPVLRRAMAGEARAAEAAEAPLLSAWLDAFIDEARLPDDKASVRASVPGRIEEGKLWVWDDHGPRALLGFLRVDRTTGRIASVYTPPRARGRGYAKALTATVAGMLLDAGCTRVFLTADRANPTSNGLYASLGFRMLGEQYHFDFVRGG